MSSRSISGELSHKIIIAIAIIVLGGIGGIIAFTGRKVAESVRDNAQSSLDTYIGDIESMLGEIETMNSFVSWQLADHIDNPDYIPVINGKVMDYGSMVSGVTIAFIRDFYPEKGEYYAMRSYRDNASETVGNRLMDDYYSNGWFKVALEKNQGFWSEPYVSADAGMVTTYSAPLMDAVGVPYAVLAIDISLEGITERIAGKHLYEGSHSVILSSGGAILSHPDRNLLLRGVVEYAKSVDDSKFEELSRSMIAGESGIGEVRSEKAAAIYGPVANGWSAAIICPAEEIFGTTVKFQLLILLIALFDILVLYIVTRTIISRTLLPITEVTYLAKNVAKGNFKAEIPKVTGNNEMFHLNEALRNMLKSINDYIIQLRSTTAANERFESELSIASNIQQQMLRTDFINDDEVDLFATLKPAKEVGGDMYDFLRAGRTIYFAVGDVSGKGVPAALYMAISRSLFHYVSGMSLDTSNIVSCINSSFCSGNESNMFITMFVGRLDLDTRELVFCNAGHNPVVIISPDGKAEYIKAKSNLAAGVFDMFPYEKESIIVEKGSRLLIYTDGVTEAEDAAKNQYGEDRLIEFAGSMAPDTSSEEFVNRLTESIKGFTKDNDQNDDITIMSVRV